MARPLRIEFPGAWYHVVNRGTGKRWTFKKDQHYQYFLSLLADISERFSCEIHAYCLMGNHYHLMLRTPEGGLQRMMRHVNGVYTQYFNRLEKTDGALFRGRYKAILVDAQAHWLALSRYIHRNPLEANIVKRLEAYRWSSYPAYVGKVPTPEWLHTTDILGTMGKRQVRTRYRDYVTHSADDSLSEQYQSKAIGPILGDEVFKQAILEKQASHPEIPQSRSQRIRPSLDQVLDAVSRYYEVDREKLFISTRGRGVRSPARSMAMYLCQHRCGMKLPRVAKEFGLSGYASAGSTIRHIRERLEEDEQLQGDLYYILQDLTPSSG